MDRRQRMPKRTAGKEKRQKTAHRRQHGPQPGKPRLHESLFERHAFSPRFLDQIAQDDDMTDNDAGETNNAGQRHESQGRMCQGQASKSANQSERHREQHNHSRSVSQMNTSQREVLRRLSRRHWVKASTASPTARPAQVDGSGTAV
jgi:hypothetical protein